MANVQALTRSQLQGLTRPLLAKPNRQYEQSQSQSIQAKAPTSGLRNVCLASKSIRRSAESALYSAITLKWNHELEPRIITLLEILLRKPELFDCIHALSLDRDEFVGDEDPPRALTPSRSAVASFTQAIQKLKTPITGL
ncbi:hypothetical protein V2G26_010911 [Clonostachys chloroleuca]